MSTDFNPGNYDQPDFAKDEARSARMGFGLFLLGIFTISQSIQIFSRVPGTSGPLFILGHIVCMAVQGWFYSVGVEQTGKPDLIGIALPIGVQVIWLFYTIIATFGWRLKGVAFEVNQLGVGILYRQMRDKSAAAVGFASDMLVAVSFTTTCFLLESPILGRWYFYVSVALLIGHLWMDYRVRKEMRRLNQARSRAQDWTYKLNQANRR